MNRTTLFSFSSFPLGTLGDDVPMTVLTGNTGVILNVGTGANFVVEGGETTVPATAIGAPLVD